MEHDVDHHDIHHGFATGGEHFVVLTYGGVTPEDFAGYQFKSAAVWADLAVNASVIA